MSSRRANVNPEASAARRLAAALVALVVGAGLLALSLRLLPDIVAVLSLPLGAQRPEVVTVIELLPPIKDQVIEHTVERSDFLIEAKAPPVVIPEPVTEARVEPTLPPPPERKPRPRRPERKARPEPPSELPESSYRPGAAAEGPDSGSAPGSEAATLTGSSETERASALAIIVATIESHKRYPRKARETGLQGRVVLTVRIGNGGTVTGVSVKEALAAPTLVRAASQAAEPLVGMSLPVTAALLVDVPVVFSLSD